MFGFGKKDDQAEKDRDAAIDRGKQTVRDFVHGLVNASPEDAERRGKQLKDWCGSDKLVPLDFKHKAMRRAQELECAANMRKCDTLLHDSSISAIADNLAARAAKLNDARRYFSKACSLGADQDWKKAFHRAEETILMTGGVHRPGPSRAKPADIAPRAANRAKA